MAGVRRREKPHIGLITHTCPAGHEWKSMLANAKDCPECRREAVKAEAKREILLEKVDYGEYRVTTLHGVAVRETFTGDSEAEAVGLYVCRRTLPNMQLLGEFVLENAEALGLTIRRVDSPPPPRQSGDERGKIPTRKGMP